MKGATKGETDAIKFLHLLDRVNAFHKKNVKSGDSIQNPGTTDQKKLRKPVKRGQVTLRRILASEHISKC
jgi:hypothetical protein